MLTACIVVSRASNRVGSSGCRAELTLILLPMIGVEEAERMMACADVPKVIIERVLTQPSERRAIIVGASSS
ncbi:hypothetical protein ABIB42_001179 [Massilia sp. UYP32]|jgi:hypothetical protein|uniref:hypothetical protein n=1 Tax=Massilia TaxID=149698 RepID=UPI000D8289BA|nr:hypothetical protein [Massilia timonae]